MQRCSGPADTSYRNNFGSSKRKPARIMLWSEMRSGRAGSSQSRSHQSAAQNGMAGRLCLDSLEFLREPSWERILPVKLDQSSKVNVGGSPNGWAGAATGSTQNDLTNTIVSQCVLPVYLTSAPAAFQIWPSCHSSRRASALQQPQLWRHFSRPWWVKP
jgi:hypothetical protein